jgi:hypothetical protein
LRGFLNCGSRDQTPRPIVRQAGINFFPQLVIAAADFIQKCRALRRLAFERQSNNAINFL